MPRQNKEQAVTNALREEGLKIIASDKATSTEKMHWSKLLFDMQDVTKQELTVQVKQAEDAREAAESALKTAQDALAAANAKVAELEPPALRLAAVEAELAVLKSEFDARITAMREELVEEAKQREWKAQRSESEARDTLQSAQRQFSNKGFEALMDAMRNLVESNNIPQPDIWNLPENVNPLYLTLWGWSPIKASLFAAFTKSYPEPTEQFKQALERCLVARLPVRGSDLIPLEQLGIEPDPTVMRTEGPKPTEHLTEKIEVLMMMCERWPGVLAKVQRRVEDEQVRRQADAMRHNTAMLEAQQQDLKRLGYGKDELIEPLIDTHWEGCGCNKCENRRSGRNADGRPTRDLEEIF